MKLRVRLFGTLGGSMPGYDPLRGLEIQLPDGARVADLLAELGFSPREAAVVSVDNRIARPDQALAPGCLVRVLQAMYGG